jgi:chemotaxis protein MotC
LRPTTISLVLLSLTAPLAAETTQAVEPFDMVRTLSALQSKMSRGDDSARSAAAKQIERIEQTFPSVAPEQWKDPKNARAVAVYLMSGGSPRNLRKMLDEGMFPEEDKALIAGSLAYAEGRIREAAKLLQSIEPRKLPPTLGGHLALVQGGLLIGSNNPQALALFDLARLLMPGSLVEEAALRREISILDGANEPEKLFLLGRRYTVQYSHSPFVRNFWDELGAATIRMALHVSEARLIETESLFQGMNPGSKFDVYLAIARTAILNARIALAASQTKNAEPFAQTPNARSRLKLYNALIEAISGNFEDSVAELKSVNSTNLSRADIEMRDIVTATMQRLQGPSENRAKTANAPASPQSEAEAETVGYSPIEVSARRAIADADALLQRASKP